MTSSFACATDPAASNGKPCIFGLMCTLGRYVLVLRLTLTWPCSQPPQTERCVRFRFFGRLRGPGRAFELLRIIEIVAVAAAYKADHEHVHDCPVYLP